MPRHSEPVCAQASRQAGAWVKNHVMCSCWIHRGNGHVTCSRWIHMGKDHVMCSCWIHREKGHVTCSCWIHREEGTKFRSQKAIKAISLPCNARSAVAVMLPTAGFYDHQNVDAGQGGGHTGIHTWGEGTQGATHGGGAQ